MLGLNPGPKEWYSVQHCNPHTIPGVVITVIRNLGRFFAVSDLREKINVDVGREPRTQGVVQCLTIQLLSHITISPA